MCVQENRIGTLLEHLDLYTNNRLTYIFPQSLSNNARKVLLKSNFALTHTCSLWVIPLISTYGRIHAELGLSIVLSAKSIVSSCSPESRPKQNDEDMFTSKDDLCWNKHVSCCKRVCVPQFSIFPCLHKCIFEQHIHHLKGFKMLLRWPL